MNQGEPPRGAVSSWGSPMNDERYDFLYGQYYALVKALQKIRQDAVAVPEAMQRHAHALLTLARSIESAINLGDDVAGAAYAAEALSREQNLVVYETVRDAEHRVRSEILETVDGELVRVRDVMFRLETRRRIYLDVESLRARAPSSQQVMTYMQERRAEYDASTLSLIDLFAAAVPRLRALVRTTLTQVIDLQSALHSQWLERMRKIVEDIGEDSLLELRSKAPDHRQPQSSAAPPPVAPAFQPRSDAPDGGAGVPSPSELGEAQDRSSPMRRESADHAPYAAAPSPTAEAGAEGRPAPPVVNDVESELRNFDPMARREPNDTSSSASVGDADVPLSAPHPGASDGEVGGGAPGGGGGAVRDMAKRKVAEGVQARAEEKLSAVKEREQAESRRRDELSMAKDALEYVIASWTYHGQLRGNLRALLASLDQVMPSEWEWKSVSYEALGNVSKVKLHYNKSMLLVHPDKAMGRPLQQRALAELLFEELQNAWRVFNAELEGVPPPAGTVGPKQPNFGAHMNATASVMNNMGGAVNAGMPMNYGMAYNMGGMGMPGGYGMSYNMQYPGGNMPQHMNSGMPYYNMMGANSAAAAMDPRMRQSNPMHRGTGNWQQ